MGIWVAASVASSVAVVTDGLPVIHDDDWVVAGTCVGDPNVVPIGKALHKFPASVQISETGQMSILAALQLPELHIVPNRSACVLPLRFRV